MLVYSVLVCLGTIPYALRAQPASIDIHTQHANHASSYKLLAVGASMGGAPLWIDQPLTNQPTNLWGGVAPQSNQQTGVEALGPREAGGGGAAPPAG